MIDTVSNLHNLLKTTWNDPQTAIKYDTNNTIDNQLQSIEKTDIINNIANHNKIHLTIYVGWSNSIFYFIYNLWKWIICQLQ